MTEAEEEKKKIRVAVYLRVSTIEQAKKYGPDIQIQGIERYINQRPEYEFDSEKHLYTDADEGISGVTALEERKAGMQMLQDIEDHIRIYDEPPFDLLLVWRIDRLARKVTILYEVVEKLRQYGIYFVSTTEYFDASTPFGKAILGILGVFAELEREVISQRTVEGVYRSKKGGKPQRARFGYKKDVTGMVHIYEKQAKVVRDIYEMFVWQNKSLAQIAREFEVNKIPIPTISNIKKNKKLQDKEEGIMSSVKNPYHWKDSTIRDILKDKTYLGEYYFGKTKKIINKKTGKPETIIIDEEDWELADKKIPQIIDLSLFELAQKKLAPTTSKAAHTAKYLLQGLLRCDACADKRKKMLHWQGKPGHGGGRPIYLCMGKSSKFKGEEKCHTLPLDADELEKLVIYHMKQLLLDNDYVQKIYNQKGKFGLYAAKLQHKKIKLEKALEQHEAEKKKIADMYTHGLKAYTLTELSQKLEEKDTIMREIIKELNQISKEITSSVSLDGYIRGLQDFKERAGDNVQSFLKDRQHAQKLLQYLIDEIIVYSEEVDKNIPLPGVRKDGDRELPYRIMIRLNLPQDFTIGLGKGKMA